MTELAKLIRVDSKGERLAIDGKRFPWYISEKGVRTQVQRSDLPAITVDILAERLEIVDVMPGKAPAPSLSLWSRLKRRIGGRK